MMQYWILVFNHRRMDRFDEDGLITALKGVNLARLCEQYGLDRCLIAPALAHLHLVAAPVGVVPFSALHYQEEGQRPLFLQSWDASRPSGTAMLAAYLVKSQSELLTARLKDTQQIWGISLSPNQLRDMGLVFAYETARWMAALGQGLVHGLDGCWYRLNRHNAFLPLQVYSQDNP